MFANASVVNEVITVLIEFEYLLQMPPGFDLSGTGRGDEQKGVVMFSGGESWDTSSFEADVVAQPLPPLPHFADQDVQESTTSKLGKINQFFSNIR